MAGGRNQYIGYIVKNVNYRLLFSVIDYQYFVICYVSLTDYIHILNLILILHGGVFQ